MSDPGIIDASGVEELIIADFSFKKVACLSLDLSVLGDHPDLKGENTDLPMRGGAIANRRWAAATTYRVPIHLTGALDFDGAPNEFPRAGLTLNQDALLEEVVSFAEASQPATWILEDGSERTAEVQATITFGSILGDCDKEGTLYVCCVNEEGRFVVSGS